MNVFATLKTVFFGSKFLSSPVPIDGTPRRDLVSALNGLMPLCRTIPGVRLALDIREGQVVLALNWTPRTDGNASTGSYHYIVSDEDGVREMADSQVLLTETVRITCRGVWTILGHIRQSQLKRQRRIPLT